MVLKIELELLEPTHVASVDQLLQLHPSQITGLIVQLTGEGDESLGLSLRSGLQRAGIQDLVRFAQRIQPDGTAVEVSYRGRLEAFVI
jgi:hypothetical protein